MIGYRQDLLEDTDNARSISLSMDGMYLELRCSNCGIPYYIVGFGPNDYRGFAYISVFDPRYISDVDSMLSEEYRNQFATIIQANWIRLKTDEYWKEVLPDIMPDYFKLKCQNNWKHNSIDLDTFFNSTMYARQVYIEKLLDFSIHIVESSAYPDIVFFKVHTHVGDAYIDAINFYYLTGDRLTVVWEEYFARIIHALWDRILKLNNRVLDCCPDGLLCDDLSERY